MARYETLDVGVPYRAMRHEYVRCSHCGQTIVVESLQWHEKACTGAVSQSDEFMATSDD